MLGIVVNEEKMAKEIIESKVLTSDMIKNISLIVKYYYISKGVTDKQELKEKIFSLLKDKYDGYKRAKWESTIDRTVSLFLKNAKYKKEDKVNNNAEFYPNKEFTNISDIKITEKELKYINNLDDKNLEKVSFIMLVYAKITNITLRENLNWVGQSISNILKEAKVNLKGNDKELLLHKLYNTKLYDEEYIDTETGEILNKEVNYISMTKSNSKNSFKLNYTEDINEDSKIEIAIDDFDSVIYYYLKWKGEKWKRCECCSKWIQIKSKKPPKYCKKCKEIKQLEWDRGYKNRLKNE